MEQAERMLEEALQRLRRAQEQEHRYWMRDSAIRAWNAVLRATDALLTARNALPPAPLTPLKRRQALARLEAQDPRLQGLRERLAGLETLLYRDAFYEMQPDPQALERDIGTTARAYLEAVRALMGGA